LAVHTFADAFALLRGLTNYERQGTMRYDKTHLDLDRMRSLLRGVGSPEVGLPILHVAGTKGKGSVAEMLAVGLAAGGRRVGLYTSPHLRHVRERVRVDGRPIGERPFARLVEALRPRLLREEGRPTFFEILTALALVHFRDEAVDAAVLEVGLGGRFDATNVVRPVVTVITSISHEHTRYLGRTLRAIAREKAGILKAGVPLVSGVPDASSAGRAIRERAEDVGAPVRVLGRDFELTSVRRRRPPARGSCLDWRGTGGELTGITLPALGRHQARNAALALETLAIAGRADPRLAVPPAALRRGMGRVRLEGRLQVVSRAPWLVLDGAHNPASIRATLEAVREGLTFDRLAVVLGAMRDKKVAGILDEVLAAADVLVPVRARLARAMPAEEMAARAFARRRGRRPRIAVEASLAGAMDEAREAAGPDGAVLVTGSLVLAGEAMGIVEAEARGGRERRR
jgi:dihydrofolate synthase/folylpolyglutamate synthase